MHVYVRYLSTEHYVTLNENIYYVIGRLSRLFSFVIDATRVLSIDCFGFLYKLRLQYVCVLRVEHSNSNVLFNN